MDQGNASGSRAIRRYSLIVQGLIPVVIASLITDEPWSTKLIASSLIMLPLVVIAFVRK